MVNWIISSSVLIICVVIIRYILKGKISPGLQYALWGLVLLRLFIPFNVGNSKISVENFTDNIVEAYERDMTAMEEAALVNNMKYEIVEEDIFYDEADVVDTVNGEDSIMTGAMTAVESKVSPTETVPAKEKLTLEDAAVFIKSIAVYVWATGMVLVALIFVYTNVRFVIATGKDKKQIVAKQKGKLPVYFSDNIETPCLYGIIRPKIYVNSETLSNEQTFRYVQEHELTHYHHGDNIWCVLRFAAIALYWYNPLVWLAVALSKKDSELACDEGTIKCLGETERIGYGMTLINMSCKKSAAIFNMVATMAGSKKNIQERIVFIARKPKTTMRTLVAVVLVMAAIVGVTFTGAVKVAELPLIKAEKQGDSVTKTKSTIIEDKFGLADYSKTSKYPQNISCVVGAGSYPVGTGVSYVTDMYDRVMYGTKGSFAEIYADRTGMEFRLLDESDVENELIKAVYDMYNSEGLKITLYDKRTTPLETYTSYSPDKAEYLAELISQYTWEQIDGIATVESDYMIEITVGSTLFKCGTMRFYDIGDGMLSYYNDRKNTYWKAVAKSSNTASITEQLREDYFNIKIDLTRMVISGCENENEAFDYFIEVVYPATRLDLETGNPYKISDYKLLGAGREVTESERVKEGWFRFTCIPEGEAGKLEKKVTCTVEATNEGTWIFQYHDCDKE